MNVTILLRTAAIAALVVGCRPTIDATELGAADAETGSGPAEVDRFRRGSEEVRGQRNERTHDADHRSDSSQDNGSSDATEQSDDSSSHESEEPTPEPTAEPTPEPTPVPTPEPTPIPSSVLNFDGYISTCTRTIPNLFGGFTWQNAGLVNRSCYPDLGYFACTLGTSALFTMYGRDITMSRSTPFSFVGAYIGTTYFAGLDITVSGSLLGVPVFSTVVTTHNDQPYWFDFNSEPIDSLTFSTPDATYGTVDNLTYQDR